MASFVDSNSSDEYVSCPYNSAHTMRASRLIYHIVKCSKNPGNPQLLVCPFNAKHRIPAPMMIEHLNDCEHMVPGVIGPVDLEAYQEYANASKSTIDVSPVDQPVNNCGNNWDNDVNMLTTPSPAEPSTSETINKQTITFDAQIIEKSDSNYPQDKDYRYSSSSSNDEHFNKAARGTRANYRSVVASIHKIKYKENNS